LLVKLVSNPLSVSDETDYICEPLMMSEMVFGYLYHDEKEVTPYAHTNLSSVALKWMTLNGVFLLLQMPVHCMSRLLSFLYCGTCFNAALQLIAEHSCPINVYVAE